MRRDFARSSDSLEGIFAFIREFFAAEGLDAGRTFTVDLVTEELFTNMVKYNAQSPVPVALALERTGDRLTLELTDSDTEEFDITRTPDVDVSESPETRRVGGLGIHLVRKLAESVSYRYRGRTGRITVVLKLEGDDVRH